MAASKQPERASLNLKVISLTHSLSLFLHCSLLFFLILAFPFPLFGCLSSSHPLFRQVSLFFSPSPWVFFTCTEGLCLFSLSLLLPSLSPFHSVCHCSVLFSSTASQSLKEQLDCLSVLPLSQNWDEKHFKFNKNRCTVL